MSIAPVVSKVRVKAKPARAFELFFNHMTEWWRTCDGEKPFVAMVLEPSAGGRWYERDAEGKESEWGRVLAYEPPHRLLLGWGFDATFKYNPDVLTEVELTFTANEGGGTDVRLEHRGLERFGAEAAKVAAGVGGGWTRQMQAFAAHVDQRADQPQKQEA
jgi:uncharacterized protein YndB with AHSA1/START domain